MEAFSMKGNENKLFLLSSTPDVKFYEAETDVGKWIEYANKYINHEFNLLGSGWVKVFYGMKAEGFEGRNYSETNISYESIFDTVPDHCKEYGRQLGSLAKKLVNGYEPIDWHIDFKSGYRTGIIYYTEIKYGIAEGFDAKVSFDLSRFYQLVILAKAWKLTGNDRYRKEIMAQILDWISINPVNYGTNWSANMNVGIRIINWITAFYMIKDSFKGSIPEEEVLFLKAFQKSILEHRRYMLANLEFGETSIHPNHYIADLGGLLTCSMFSKEWDPDGEACCRLALREIGLELDRQIGKDGFDYESATSYHAFCLEMFIYPLILAARVLGCNTAEEVRLWMDKKIGIARTEKFRKMFTALRDLIQPDGRIPLVGDADSGRMILFETPGHEVRDLKFLSCVGTLLFEDNTLLPGVTANGDWTTAGTLFQYGNKHESTSSGCQESACYPAAGFYIMKSGEAYSMIFCGPIGTGGVGGHAHDDKLSFTLCVNGMEIFVDPGVYVYTANKKYRDDCRSVLMHNTVCIGGQPQNRYLENSPWWGCHEDTHCACLKWEDGKDMIVFEGQHEGYLRLKPGIIHRRRIELKKENGEYQVSDTFISENDAACPYKVEFSFILHPACNVEILDHNTAVIDRGKVRLSMYTEHGILRMGKGFFSTAYGIRQIAPRLYLRFDGGIRQNRITIQWRMK